MPKNNKLKLSDRDLKELLMSQNIQILAALKLNSDKDDLLRRMDLKIGEVMLKLDAQKIIFEGLERKVNDHDFVIHGKEGSPYLGLVPVFQNLLKRHEEHQVTVDNFIDKHQLITAMKAGEVGGKKEGQAQGEASSDRKSKRHELNLKLIVGFATGIISAILTLLGVFITMGKI